MSDEISFWDPAIFFFKGAVAVRFREDIYMQNWVV